MTLARLAGYGLVALVVSPVLAGGPFTVKLARPIDQGSDHMPAGTTCTLLQYVNGPEFSLPYYKVVCPVISVAGTDGETHARVIDVLITDVTVVTTPALGTP